MGRGRRTIEQRTTRVIQLVRWLAENDVKAFSRIESRIEAIGEISRRCVKEIDE